MSLLLLHFTGFGSLPRQTIGFMACLMALDPVVLPRRSNIEWRVVRVLESHQHVTKEEAVRLWGDERHKGRINIVLFCAHTVIHSA